MSTINPAELQSARFAVLYPVARKYLFNEECVELGNLIGSHWIGRYSSLETVGDALDESTWAEQKALYELVLNQLEQDFGPLIYRAQFPDGDTTDVAWGYAGRILECPAAWTRGEELTPYQISEMWVSRLLALQDGHPDQETYARGEPVPTAAWRIAPNNIATCQSLLRITD